MSLFITGTDTDAGKTTVAAWICSHLKVPYWKLIQTGSDSDSATVQRLAPQTPILPEVYRLKAPLSAWDAARLEQVTVDPNRFQPPCTPCVIEGAGGLLVPIAEDFCMIDALEQTQSTALIVARSKLGMINHILLTIFALHQRQIPIAGIVISGAIEPYIQKTIEQFSKERIVAVLPESSDLPRLFERTPIPEAICKELS